VGLSLSALDFSLVSAFPHGLGLIGITTTYIGIFTKPGISTGTTDGDGTQAADLYGDMNQAIEEGLLTETGQQVSVSEDRLHAHTGQVQRLVVIPVGILKGVRGNLREVLLKDQEASTGLREG
jgi:hypothetical protein